MINLAKSYDKKIAAAFSKNSYVMGNSVKDYSFSGVKSVTVYTPQTVGLNDYVRDGENRFGVLKEMQDSVQELELSQDKSFTLAIDRGNDEDQMHIKKSSEMLSLQFKEQVIPYMDRYALRRWSYLAGTVKGVEPPSKDTIVSQIFDGAKTLDNLLVPDDHRVLYLPTTQYNMLQLSKEFLAVDPTAKRVLENGCVGRIANMSAVKVPDVYMPEGVYFLITYKGSVLNPVKIKTMRALNNVKGIDGSVLEGRNYFDAFVIGAKAGGVYAAVNPDLVLEAPVIAKNGNSCTITAKSGVTFMYTTDGSDPRYSKNAKQYTAAVTLEEGETFRACGEKEGKYKSAVSSI